MPGQIYKWEENNRGLDHKCGTCKTVLTSPRAKKTCFGVHEEVCTRYHKTLFFVGQSHNCDACRKTIELHDKRHREIVTLLKRIQSLDGVLKGKDPFPNRKRRNKKRPVTTSGEDGNQPLEDPEWENGSWNDSSTLNDDDTNSRVQNWDPDLGSPGEKRQAKAERKTAKHQAQVDVISEHELSRLAGILHPNKILFADRRRQNGQGLVNNQTIEENIAFSSRTFQHDLLRLSPRSKTIQKTALLRRKNAQTSQEDNGTLIDSIIQDLGINPHLHHASKGRKSLQARLRSAIHADLVAVANEEQGTMQRMAGYWRYVNRRTYNAMVRVNELWDWATGEKLPEIEEDEDDDLESAVTLAGSTSDMLLAASGSALQGLLTQDLESYDDDDFDLPDELKELRLSSRFDENVPGFEDDNPKATTKDPEPCAVTGHDEYNGNKFAGLRLAYIPGQLPGPTISFSVPSPSSSDDFFDGEISDITEDEDGAIITTKSLEDIFTIHEPGKKNEESKLDNVSDFRSQKDTRVLDKVIRSASTGNSKPNKKAVWTYAVPKGRTYTASKNRFHTIGISPKVDHNNRFGTLENEIAAPREKERLKPEPSRPSTASVLGKNIIQTQNKGVLSGIQNIASSPCAQLSTKKSTKSTSETTSNDSKTPTKPPGSLHETEFPSLSKPATTSNSSTKSLTPTPAKTEGTKKNKECGTPTPSKVISITPEVVKLADSRAKLKNNKTLVPKKRNLASAMTARAGTVVDGDSWTEVVNGRKKN